MAVASGLTLTGLGRHDHLPGPGSHPQHLSLQSHGGDLEAPRRGAARHGLCGVDRGRGSAGCLGGAEVWRTNEEQQEQMGLYIAMVGFMMVNDG